MSMFCLLSASENGGGDDEAAELRRVYEELDSIESAKAPARASQILSGLGFGTLDQIRPTRSVFQSLVYH